MSFVGIEQREIPKDIRDMFAPLIPYIIDFNIQNHKDGRREGWITFLIPDKLIDYDIDIMKQFFKSISVQYNREAPIDSIGVLIPTIYNKVESHTITVELK